MKAKIKEQWIKALRSGKYKKTKGVLRDKRGYCCLGVLCDLHRKSTKGKWIYAPWSSSYRYYDNTGVLPPTVVQWAGLPNENPSVDGGCLSVMNDGGYSFKKIAYLIEECL